MNKLGCLVLVLGLIIVVVVFAVRQCSGPTGTVEFEVRRKSASVSSGATYPLSALADGSYHDLPEGHYVSTDVSGEAQLRGKTGGSTCYVYLFHSSGLAKHACSKSSAAGASTSCLEEGSAVYQHCSSHLITTGSSQVRVEGSWVWVTYLPRWQFTLVVVAEGSATVWPVTRSSDWKLGSPILLRTGEFWYSAPDARLPEISSQLGANAPREALAMDGLRPLIARMEIEGWFRKALEQAKRDGIPEDRFPPDREEPPPLLPGLSIVLQGGPLDDERVREAVLRAVPWEQIGKEVFWESDPRMSVVLRGVEMDAREVLHDPMLARSLLAEAGFPDGITLRVLYPQEDGQLASMAEWTIKDLHAARIQALLQPVPDAEAEAHLKELSAASQAVLALSWR